MPLILRPLVIATAFGVSAVPALVGQAPAGELKTERTTKPERREKRDKSERRWRISSVFDFNAGFDDNVFLLESSKRDNLETPSTAELTSGRYLNMESPSDVMVALSAGLSIEGPGFLGKSSRLAPEIVYNRYERNVERTNLGLGLVIQEDLGSDRRIRLRGQLTPNYFPKNYLADAIDLDASGSISDDERRYARGEYSEQSLAADYRFRLAKPTAERRLGAAMQMGGGYYNRGYQAPFTGRDLHGPTAEARILLDIGHRVSFDLGYEFESLSGTPADQVMLLDEPDFGRDLNGNGTQTDQNARVVSMVDPSRKEHSLGAAVGFELNKGTDLHFGYQHRWRRYSSQQPLDVGYNGRRDARGRASADLQRRLNKDLRLRLGVSRAVQNLNRTGDPGSTGEVTDYSRWLMDLGLSYQL